MESVLLTLSVVALFLLRVGIPVTLLIAHCSWDGN